METHNVNICVKKTNCKTIKIVKLKWIFFSWSFCLYHCVHIYKYVLNKTYVMEKKNCKVWCIDSEHNTKKKTSYRKLLVYNVKILKEKK